MPIPLAVPLIIAGAAAAKGMGDAAARNIPGSKAPATPYAGGYPTPPQDARAPGYTDVDLSSPGQAEQFWRNQAGNWTQPSEAGGYWRGVQGRMAQPPRFGMEAYTEAKRMAAPDTSGYYDRAESKVMNAVNRGAAATGMLGSKYNQDALSRASIDLRAEEARNAGQYQLQRAQTLGSLAQGAGGEELQWLLGGGQLAQMADAQRLAALESGMRGATTAQELYRQRGLDAFNTGMALDAADANLLAGLGGQVYGADAAMLDQVMNAALGNTGNAANAAAAQDAANTNLLMSGIGAGINAYNSGLAGGQPAALNAAKIDYYNRMGR